jgi:hypothetical protein
LVGVDDGSIVQPVQAHCVRLENIGGLDTCPTNEQPTLKMARAGSAKPNLIESIGFSGGLGQSDIYSLA